MNIKTKTNTQKSKKMIMNPSTDKRQELESDTDKNLLPLGYTPAENDVLCGKGKTCYTWKGNQRFRTMVDLYLEHYAAATSKMEKSAIVSAIVQAVRQESPQGGFIKQDRTTDRWYEVGDLLAREKVGQTIRDALHFKYRSSTKSKKKRRQAEQAKASAKMKKITTTHDIIWKKIQDLQNKVSDEGKEKDDFAGCHIVKRCRTHAVPFLLISDDEGNLSSMFTQANLEILNELNRLSQNGASAFGSIHAATPMMMPQTAAVPGG